MTASKSQLARVCNQPTPATPPVHPPTVPLLPGHGGPTEEQRRQGGLARVALPDAPAFHSAGGKSRVALPDAPAFHCAGGTAANHSKAGKASWSNRERTAKQLPEGPCPCPHLNHEGGKCGKLQAGGWRGLWCKSCAGSHRPKLQAQGMARAAAGDHRVF
jgi:hypothetical protein